MNFLHASYNDAHPDFEALRGKLLDPCINLIVRNMRKELAAKDDRIMALQKELEATHFSPKSYVFMHDHLRLFEFSHYVSDTGTFNIVGGFCSADFEF